jgi:hypothetical protein
MLAHVLPLSEAEALVCAHKDVLDIVVVHHHLQFQEGVFLAVACPFV